MLMGGISVGRMADIGLARSHFIRYTDGIQESSEEISM
jgi:hypothetical protein